jgi:hypothetical protein
MKFIKAIFILGLIGVAAFLAIKKINWKPEKSEYDYQREYNITCKRILDITRALDESFEEAAIIPRADYVYELKDYIVRYAQNLVLKDAWGQDLLFKLGDMGNFYVASAGSDLVFDGFDQRGEYTGYDGHDIIMERVAWLLYPKNRPGI